MSANTSTHTDQIHNVGLSSPHPAETHQKAGGFLLEKIKTAQGEGFGAKLLANPGKGDWLLKVGPVFLIQEPNGYTHAIAEKWVKEHHRKAAAAVAAVASIEMGNNGYADIGTCTEVADAVAAAGFTVIRSRNLHGMPVFRGFTRSAQEALKSSPFGECTIRALNVPVEEDGADVEAMILAQSASLIDL